MRHISEIIQEAVKRYPYEVQQKLIEAGFVIK